MSTERSERVDELWTEFSSGKGREIAKNVRGWWADGLDRTDPLLLNLLKKAATALHEEDQVLHRLLEGAVSGKGVSTGLAYWLFETTLVYIIFKAWLAAEPRRLIQWERGYGKNLRKKADLTVGEIGKVDEMRFECKWWNSNNKPTLEAIKYDLGKFANLKKGRGILVAFWWGCEGDECIWSWKAAWKKIDEARGRKYLKRCTPIFAARFQTHVVIRKKHSGHKQHFAIAAFA